MPTFSSRLVPAALPTWATRTSRSPKVSRIFSSSWCSRPAGSWMRISTMPCLSASLSIRETLERLVPSAVATSACERPWR